MNTLNKLYNKLFNSPPNHDDISIKKTKLKIIQFIIIAIIGWLILFLVIYIDTKNKPTFINNEIQDTITLPTIQLSIDHLDILQFSINKLNITQDYNQVDCYNYYSNSTLFYCVAGNTIETSECDNGLSSNSSSTGDFIWGGSSLNAKGLYIQNSTLSNNQDYLNINFQLWNIPVNQSFTLRWSLVVGTSSYFFSGPTNVQVLVTKEIYIDKNGIQSVSIKSDAISSLLNNYYCQVGTMFYTGCFENTVSVYYKTNIVNLYSQETNSYLVLRILKNVFSIGNMVLVLVSLLLSFIFSKIIYLITKDPSSLYDNSIRDSVLYHFNEYLVETSLNTFIMNKDGEDNNDKQTLGSNSRLKRLIESIPLQDSYSKSLSKISKVQSLLLVVILLTVSIVIINKDLKTNTIITKLNDQDEIELPNFNITIKSADSKYDLAIPVYQLYFEILPNNQSKECSILGNHSTDFGFCFGWGGNPDLSNYPNNTVAYDGYGFYYNQSSIKLKRNQQYMLLIQTNNFYMYYFYDKVYYELQLNNATYYINPFNKIDIQLTKSILYQANGNVITFYDPSFIVSPYDGRPQNTSNPEIISIKGVTYFNITYNSFIVKEIYERNLIQMSIKIITDISAFFSPINLVVGFIFTSVLVKLLYKYPSSHSITNRESIIYYLNNYQYYKSLFKNKNNNYKNTTNNNNNNKTNQYSIIINE